MPLPIPRPAAAVSRLFFGLKYAAALAGLLLPGLGAAQEFPRRAPALDRLATSLQGDPALRLRIAGHTDRLGEPGKNQVLSEQRAAAVKAYLVKNGVAAARLKTVGYGDSRPLHPSPDVRNRRVEIEKLP